MSRKKIVLRVELESPQAIALAQFLKRVGWSEMRANAADENECYLIRDALHTVEKELNSNGYAPR
jgi:hypothetical protein